MSDVLCNLRDVGGLPLDGGGHVTPGVLYRGDAPVTGDHAPDIRPWPPRTVIDLRAPNERARTIAPEPWPESTRVVEIALLGKLDPVHALNKDTLFDTAELGIAYREMLSDTAAVVRAVSEIAIGAAPVLVHCTAGMDRTGLVVALTLDAIGVPWPVLEQQHLLSNEAHAVLNARLTRAIGQELPRPLHRADIDSFRHGTDLWRARPGGAAGWLLDHGLPRADLAELRSRLRSA